MLYFLKSPCPRIRHELYSIKKNNNNISKTHQFFLALKYAIDNVHCPNHINATLITTDIPVIQNCGLFHVPASAVTPLVGHDYCSLQT
jgi:hypothetical protein